MMQSLGFAALCVTLVAATVQADSIWQWTHEGSASGMANVFDGGPVSHGSDMSSGP